MLAVALFAADVEILTRALVFGRFAVVTAPLSTHAPKRRHKMKAALVAMLLPALALVESNACRSRHMQEPFLEVRALAESPGAASPLPGLPRAGKRTQ